MLPALVGLMFFASSAMAAASKKPTPIYGKDSEPVGLTEEQQQIVVGILTILIFVFMALEWFTPEVLLLSALIIPLRLFQVCNPMSICGYCEHTLIYYYVYFRFF